MKPYFSHDEGARNDPKLVKVLMRLGQAGKGVYWDLVEMLYEQGGYLPLAEVESYAYALRTDAELITKLINDFGLFVSDGVNFWSETALERLKMRNEKAERRAAAGAKGGKVRAEREAIAKAALEQPLSDTQALLEDSQAMLEQSLSNKSKVNKSKEDTNTPDAEPASPSPAVSASLPPVEPCHLTAQNGGKQLNKVPAGPAFDEFWDAFGKKEDKHKASKAWAALDATQRTAALQAVTSYVAGTPDKRYRKNPLTWLNGKCWLDEETPASRQVVAVVPQPAPQLAPPAPAPAINHEFIAEQEAAARALQAAHFAKFSKPQPCSPPLPQPA